MGVVNIQSVQITNGTSSPPIPNYPYYAGGPVRESVDFLALGATDSGGSTYRFCKIPSNARVSDVALMNDTNTGGVSYKCGVLFPAGGGVIVAGSDAIFIPAGTSLAQARNVWTDLFFPAIAGNAGADSYAKLRVWELLGLTTDPQAVYDVAVSAVTPGTAGGNLALRLRYVI